MKKFTLLFAVALSALSAQAQLNGDGYYRAQNDVTTRYIRIVDDYGWINKESQTADLGAIKTRKPLSSVISDAGSIIYIRKMDQGYNFLSQGTSSYAICNYQLRLADMKNGKYRLYAAESGMSKYLNDEYGSANDAQVGFNDNRTQDWLIHPVQATGDNYFGFSPDVAVDGKYYQTFYSSFPYSMASTGLKAYYVTKIDAAWGAAIMEKVTGSVPPATPVIIECSSDEPTNNRINILTTTPAQLNGNLLEGVYFSYYTTDSSDSQHNNFKEYDPATMRVLGKLSDGSLGFVKANIARMPANSAWITVPASAPNEIKIIDADTYNAEMAKPITIKADPITRGYGDANPPLTYTVEGEGTLHGTPDITTTATITSSVGTYPISMTKGNISNTNVTLVGSNLTIEKVTMNVYARSYEREIYQPNPTLEYDFDVDAWKNNEDASVLTSPVVATTTATIASPVGVYDITLSGGVATNYDFVYHGGTLTVYEPEINAVQSVRITSPVDVYNVYGVKVRSQVRSLDELPAGLYIVNGKKVLKK